MPEDDETNVELELFAETMNGVVGKTAEAVALLQTGDVGLAAAFGGFAGGATKGMIVGGHKLWSRRKKKLGDALESARVESGGRTPTELLEIALDQDDERRLDLFLNALRKASQEADERKVRAFGRMAASGVLADDDATVDETARIFSTLAALDEADLRILLYMARQEDQPWFVHPHTGGHGIRTLIEELPEMADLFDPVVSRLRGLGLLVDRLGETIYSDGNVVSPFARLCVRELLRGEDARS